MKTLKVGVLLALLFIPLIGAFASFNGQISAQYDFFFPQQSHLMSSRFDCLWGDDNGFSFGFVATLGYGFEHYTTGDSNAYVYGPSFSLGPEIRFPLAGKLMVNTSVRALADYALYPTILRAEAEMDLCYKVTEKLVVGLGGGFLFPEFCACIHAKCGVML